MTDRRPGRLFHYTCTCAAEKIRHDGKIRPAGALTEGLTYPFVPEEMRDVSKASKFLCWFTDLEPPGDVFSLGLMILSATCSRVACCFEVECDWRVVHWWMRVRREHRDLWSLEDAPGALPAHWFVSEQPVKVLHEIGDL